MELLSLNDIRIQLKNENISMWQLRRGLILMNITFHVKNTTCIAKSNIKDILNNITIYDHHCHIIYEIYPFIMDKNIDCCDLITTYSIKDNNFNLLINQAYTTYKLKAFL